jgi:hyperosmotically inducible periplasmic protein
MQSQSTTRELLTVMAAGLLCLGARASLSQSSNSASAPDQGSVPADNSKSNATDPSNRSVTSGAQSNEKGDLRITQSIRKSLMADKALSTYAHNIKVVTVDGHVTLNGVVRTDEEKADVEAKAASVAGPSNVVNDLKVSPSQ